MKALVLVFAAQAFQLIENTPLAGASAYLEIWARWDAVHYLNIAGHGYTAAGDDRFLIVFFPLYPILVAMAGVVTRDLLVAGFVVSGIASVVLALLLHSLARLDQTPRTAYLAVFFLFIFPTSYFLHIPYTESLFLCFVVGAFLAARHRFWLITGSLGALACATRVNGLILLPALAFEAWAAYRENGELDRRCLFLLAMPAGFIAYLILNYCITGDPLMFMTYQNEHWHRYLRWPWEGIWEAAKRVGSESAADALMVGVAELFFTAIGLAAIIGGWKYLRGSYFVWMCLNWLLFVSTSFVLSVPRYTLTLFPLFILMAIMARRRPLIFTAFTAASLLYLGLFSTQFVRGWWAF